jgi:hypothetical protein
MVDQRDRHLVEQHLLRRYLDRSQRGLILLRRILRQRPPDREPRTSTIPPAQRPFQRRLQVSSRLQCEQRHRSSINKCSVRISSRRPLDYNHPPRPNNHDPRKNRAHPRSPQPQLPTIRPQHSATRPLPAQKRHRCQRNTQRRSQHHRVRNAQPLRLANLQRHL